MPVKQESAAQPRESFVQKVVNSGIIAKVGESMAKSNKSGAGEADNKVSQLDTRFSTQGSGAPLQL